MAYIENIIESGTNVVFCFGDKQVGKTCFISVLLKYLYQNHLLIYNSKYNPEGIKYIDNLLTTIENRDVPKPTSVNRIEEVDLQFVRGGKTATITIIDVSGEDLIQVKPGAIDRLTNEESLGHLDSNLTRYFEEDEVNVTILAFIDPKNPFSHDRLVSTFFNYIASNFDFNLKNAAVIFTKWDSVNEQRIGYQNLLEFMNKKTPQCYRWLKEVAFFRNAFKFSIGNVIVKDDNTKKIENVDYSYCEDIVEWLHDSCSYQFMARSDDNVADYSEEIGFFSNLSKWFLGTANPGKELREWFKIFK